MSERSEIIPAILPKNTADMRAKIEALPDSIKLIHLDVLDVDIWEDIQIAFEAHIMAANPQDIANKWFERGAKRIITHKLDEKILSLRGQVELGLGVELQTPLEEVFPLVHKVDFIHLMSIEEIGRQGHPFDERVIARIKELKQKFPQTPISVDGGVKASNFQALMESGVDRLIVGSGFPELWTLLTKN